MRIGVQTWGSDGDIRPLIALAGGLADAGHDVTLSVSSVDNKDYTHFAEALGFGIEHVGRTVFDDKLVETLNYVIRYEKNPVKQLRFIMDELFEPLTCELYDSAKRLCAENELAVGHFILHPMQAAAERAGTPYVTVTLNHSGIPTAYSPPAGLPDLGGWINRLLWKMVMVFLRRELNPSINVLRIREGLRPVGSFRQVWESSLLNLVAVSPTLCPPKKDWEDNHKVCGFFNMPERGEPWDMPDDLKRFLGSGEPPVYMGFGSMLSFEAGDEYLEETTGIMVDAARRAGVRAIVQSHWEHVKNVPDDPAIYRIGHSPHQFIFPYCAAVVHHGGAGTTQSSLMSAKPSIVVAHITDQVFWGGELYRMGVAPKPINRRDLTAGKLAMAIRNLLNSTSMKDRAGELGRNMKDEDGVGVAVRLIERLEA